MAISELNTPISIIQIGYTKDKDGFAVEVENIVASVRAYKEDKNTTEKWSNRALFQEASALFKVRYIQRVTITTDMKIDCGGTRYNITSVENVHGKNMYLEILARKEALSNGKNDGKVTG